MKDWYGFEDGVEVKVIEIGNAQCFWSEANKRRGEKRTTVSDDDDDVYLVLPIASYTKDISLWLCVLALHFCPWRVKTDRRPRSLIERERLFSVFQHNLDWSCHLASVSWRRAVTGGWGKHWLRGLCHFPRAWVALVEVSTAYVSM